MKQGKKTKGCTAFKYHKDTEENRLAKSAVTFVVLLYHHDPKPGEVLSRFRVRTRLPCEYDKIGRAFMFPSEAYRKTMHAPENPLVVKLTIFMEFSKLPRGFQVPASLFSLEHLTQLDNYYTSDEDEHNTPQLREAARKALEVFSVRTTEVGVGGYDGRHSKGSDADGAERGSTGRSGSGGQGARGRGRRGRGRGGH
eukprot:5242861-Pleurochrysis_carterae.AAC.1